MQKTIVDLAKEYAQHKAVCEAQAAVLKEFEAKWSECEEALLALMAEEGVPSVRLDGIGLFSMRVTNYLSVNAANKTSFIEYLKESGNGGIVKEDVNSRTLTAFLSEHLQHIIDEKQAAGLDPVEARNAALEFLNKKGASYFTKRDISLKKS